MFSFIKNKSDNNKFYDLLSINKNSTEVEIKKAYRNLAREYHPDRNKEQGAEKKFKEISHAYSILSDKNKKSLYDKYGEEGVDNNIDLNEFVNFDNIFDSFLNKQENVSKNSSSINLDININLKISLLDVYQGKELYYKYERVLLCENCNGLGTDNPKNIIRCDNCEGSGSIYKVNNLLPGMFTQARVPCKDCFGKGKTIKFGCLCKNCSGNNFIKININQKIIINKGINDSHKIIIDNGGNQNLDKKIGNLIATITVDENEIFKRKGNHLILEKEILLSQALTNSFIDFNFLDNKTYKFENKEIIYPNRLIVIREFGLPIYNTNNFGDLIIKFNIKFPDSLTDQRKYYLGKILPKEISINNKYQEITNSINLSKDQNTNLYKTLYEEKTNSSQKNNSFPHEQFEQFDHPGECRTM